MHCNSLERSFSRIPATLLIPEIICCYWYVHCSTKPPKDPLPKRNERSANKKAIGLWVVLCKKRVEELYTMITKIQLFEERGGNLYEKCLIPWPIHLYIGEEYVEVGVSASLWKDDYITGTHRGVSY